MRPVAERDGVLRDAILIRVLLSPFTHLDVIS